MDYDDLIRLLRALHDHEVDYVLVGGVAVNLHGIARATEDVDLFVRPDEGNVDRLRAALTSLWPEDEEEIAGITAQDLGGAYPTVRYGPPRTDFAIDILARLGTAIGFSDLEWEIRSLGDLPVRLATPATLYRMKRNTVRPVDRMDAEALRDAFGLEDQDAR